MRQAVDNTFDRKGAEELSDTLSQRKRTGEREVLQFPWFGECQLVRSIRLDRCIQNHSIHIVEERLVV